MGESSSPETRFSSYISANVSGDERHRLLFSEVSYTCLRSFHAVACAGGFTAASTLLHVGQPTITGQVRSLEDHYGVELFHRRGRKVELTETGRALFAITQRMALLEQEGQELLKAAGGLQSGELKIGATGPFLVTEMLAVFSNRYPNLNISLTVGNSMEIQELLLGFNVDLAVNSGIEEDPRLLAISFCREPIVIFVHRDHRFASRGNIRIEELQGERMIFRERGSTTRRVFEKALESAGVSVNPVMEIGSREAVWLAVSRGLGMSVVSEWEYVEHPQLKKVILNERDICTRAYVVCLKERRNSRMISAFLEVVRELKQPGISPDLSHPKTWGQ